MKERVCLLTAALLLLSCLSTWAGIGSWRSHLAYHNATQCVVVHNKVYVVSEGSLYSYSPDDEFVESYDKSNLLNEQGIRHIAVDEQSNTLVVVYNNASIDLIHPDGEVINITDFASESTLDPMVNGVNVVGGKVYLATNFGVAVLDVARAEFSNTYVLGKKTHSSIEWNGVLYAATSGGIYSGNTRLNLLDADNWTKLNNGVYAQLATFENSLLALKSKESVYVIDAVTGNASLFSKGSWQFIRTINKRLFVGGNKSVQEYKTLDTPLQLTFDTDVNSICLYGGVYWTSNGTQGLNGYRYDSESKQTVQITSQIIPNSPIRNYCQYLDFVTDERLLVAGGCLNWHGEALFDGTLMMYEGGEWSSFEEEGLANRTAGSYRNMTSIVQDPMDPRHHYASSFGQGIYEFYDMKFVRQYIDKKNQKPKWPDVVETPLESVIPYTINDKIIKDTIIIDDVIIIKDSIIKDSIPDYGYTRISRLQYDKQGNLWITNADGEPDMGHKFNNVDAPLKILKPDGSMISLYYKELENQATVADLLFDKNGWVWVTGLQKPASVVCIDLNGTLENTSDDRVKMFSEHFIDQDGGSVEAYYVNDIVEDHDGDIWVMTDKGPYVLYNTEDVFSDNYRFNKIKVPRNDGTNYADYLLDGAYTTCIEIDAANRKWIGTLSNGLYLISSDGLEMVHHFTSENSPLPSNVIESLALNHKTGELFIGTDKGLVSYMTDATRPEEEYAEEKVYAYPNPVTPDYDGLIAVVGLKANSHVKIVNTAGRLVAEGTSLGGTFTWDGRTPQGQRVSTGVYYVLGSDEEGNEGIVTKVLFIK